MQTFRRSLQAPQDSFFLFGPRGTGKSTWLQSAIDAQLYVDLLEGDRFLELSVQPSMLRDLCAHLDAGDWVVIDEIQKSPGLLDEVQWLYQRKKLRFAITGSSARKLKRTHANLLGGRLLDLRFFPLTYPEFGGSFDIEQCIRLGSMPAVARDYGAAIPVLASYLSTYIRQEILEEAVVRKLDPFRRFLDVVGQFNGQLLNKVTIARESSVKRPTIDHYFGVLEDTLMGSYVGPWNPGVKKKESAHPKFYLFDPGIVRACAGLLNQDLESEYLGFMFETFILGQIRAYLNQSFKYYEIFHYTLASSYDIDFIVQTRKRVLTRPGQLVAIEVKYGKKFRHEWIKGLCDFASLSKETVTGKHVVYCGRDRLEVEGVHVWPTAMFLDELFRGKIV